MENLSFTDYNEAFDMRMQQAERASIGFSEAEQIVAWVRVLHPDRYGAFRASIRNVRVLSFSFIVSSS